MKPPASLYAPYYLILTVRGWEDVMKPLMLEMISGGKPYDEALEREVRLISAILRGFRPFTR